MVYEFAMEMPLDEIRFILETAELNKKAAQASMKGNYGHTVSKTVSGAFGRKFMGDSAYTHMLIMTSAACDARMDGAMIPVMSNSGSGNQGIAATLPVLSFAEDIQCSEEQLIRAFDVKPFDGDLYQAKSGTLVRPLRLCGGRHGSQLRHYLSDGRR